VADELTTEMRIEARKLRAALGAEYRLRQRFAAIEWEENVLKPALADMRDDLLAGVKTQVTVPQHSSSHVQR
jgi:hypothetical protein